MYSIPFLDMPPLASAAGTVQLPGSKSISNRVLLLSALCAGQTVVHGLLASDDTEVMLEALQQLGCGVARDFEGQADSVQITGLGGRLPAPQAQLFLGNAGTAMRPLVAALAVLGGDYQLSGVARMHERPIGDLVDALCGLGCHIDYLGTEGFPPLHIGKPDLQLGEPIRVRGDVSSQFLTALLMALPLAATEQDVVIEVIGELISKPYIEITLNLLARYGVNVNREGWQRFTIAQGARYQSPKTIYVESDASSASYFIALGAMASETGIRIDGLGLDSIQGDIRFVEAAQMMGATVTSSPNSLLVQRGSWPLKAITLDCNHIPDAAMTLAVMALYAVGTTRLTNIASWRVKETDRIAAMATELRKLGATVVEETDAITITPPAIPADWRAATIHTYDDHRVAMCFSLAAFNPAGLFVRIEDPKCVAKTFPDYFETLFSVSQPLHGAPVICIDGPSASGKGTLAGAVAKQLGYHYLDSGALYRLSALAALKAGLSFQDEAGLARLASGLKIQFQDQQVWLNGEEVSHAIRSESVGQAASQIATLPALRQALLNLQRSFRKLPGLVADGRDMGTVVFGDATLKVFLTASAKARAERRYQQLINRGEPAIMESLVADLEERDERDRTRSTAPLKAAENALRLDNSQLSIAQSIDWVLSRWKPL